MASTYNNVEIFATGHHHDRDWTDADLQQALDNWNKLRTIKNDDGEPLLDPPLWIGHEELPDLASRTDLPRFGGVNSLSLRKRTDGETAMLANFNDVHPELGSWIDEKKIKDISAEFYEDWVDEQGKHWGIVLRRVCCLGGTPPQVKSLNTFNDKRRLAFGDAKQPTFTVRLPLKFADQGKSAMTRDDMLAMLDGLCKQAGIPPFDKAFLDSLSDDQLAMLVKSLGAPPSGDPNAPADPNAPPVANADDPSTVTAPTATPAPAPSAVTVKFDDVKRQLAALVDPLKRELDTTRQQLAAVRQQTADTLREEKQRKVFAFMDRMVNDGKGNCRVLPADRDRITAQLMRADAVNKVVKFGDGDKAETLTELDAQMKTIEALPVIKKFGDKMPVDSTVKTAYSGARERVQKRVEARTAGRGKPLEERLGMRPAAAMR